MKQQLPSRFVIPTTPSFKQQQQYLKSNAAAATGKDVFCTHAVPRVQLL
jgi:hypothetical protein